MGGAPLQSRLGWRSRGGWAWRCDWVSGSEAGGGLVAMEFAHAVLRIVHIEGCEGVARVGVEIVEGFEFDDGGFHGADASQSPGGGDELKHEVALDEVGRGEGVEVAKGKGLELVG
jgi:hypothetical protein